MLTPKSVRQSNAGFHCFLLPGLVLEWTGSWAGVTPKEGSLALPRFVFFFCLMGASCDTQV